MEMDTGATSIAVLIMIFVAPALGSMTPAGPLWYNYYNSSCPKVEEVVRNTVQEFMSKDQTMGAALLRLLFQDCFVGGCDASVLLDSTDKWVEKYRMPMRGFDALDTIKRAVEAACPGVVSCADIIAFAARDSVAMYGGFTFPMPAGRRDSLITYSYMDSYYQLPGYDFHYDVIVSMAANKGLNADDLVALSGAHSIGTACCRNPADDPNLLSNHYYKNVLSGQVLLWYDQRLVNRSDTAARVAYYADNPMAWKVHFAASMVKMGSIRVLTGTNGEIRRSCNVTNSAT